jgi:hypothetical protein
MLAAKRDNVIDKQTGDVCIWRRDTENQDIEHQEIDRELITINEKTHSIQAISQNNLTRVYLFLHNERNSLYVR